LQNFNTNTQHPTLWIVTEGLAGTENQCLGVAEVLGVEPEVKRIGLTQPWKLLSPYLGLECHASFTPRLSPPWPDILVTSGRKAIAASRYIKKKSQGKTFTVHIQDPRVSPKQFDIVAVPQHDPSRGDNVIVTVATPNRITAKKLEVAKQDFSSLFENIPSPRVAVLIGGSTKSHVMTMNETEKIIKQLTPLSNLMLTTSRRTGNANIRLLKENLADHYFWDGISANPYLGMLAWADVILVTSDSTSMISEAASTGKPVYTIPMRGLSKRQNQLVENLKKHGSVREFDGKLEFWTYEALADSQKIAGVIRQKCGLFR
jgi:mitochondrial fission protein ELM1